MHSECPLFAQLRPRVGTSRDDARKFRRLLETNGHLAHSLRHHQQASGGARPAECANHFETMNLMSLTSNSLHFSSLPAAGFGMRIPARLAV